jgi:hypothetical protein
MSELLSKIEKFCSLLTANKVKDSKEAFKKLPINVQKIFLAFGWEILNHKDKYSDKSYMTAFLLFKLFRGKEDKKLDVYSKYAKMATVEKMYKKAFEWNKNNEAAGKARTVSSKSDGGVKRSVTKRKYDKEYQKYEAPENEIDPLYIYYTTLLQQKPDSRLAITWLTEHGIYEEDERDALVEEYKKLVEKNKLVK